MYSIKQLSVLAGIKPHTIRVWEKRYNMFSPGRTETNIRRYSDDDLKLALNIKMLSSIGYRISRIAKMSRDEMALIIGEGNKYIGPPPVPESLLSAAINLDKQAFITYVNGFINDRGFEWTYEHLMIPFQQRMGLLWQSGGVIPAQEHFTSNLLRDIIITNISNLQPSSINGKEIIFFLPPGELHEIGLLYYSYIASNIGYKTTYLGQDVPIADVIEVVKRQNAKLLFSSYTVSIPDVDFTDQVSRLLKSLPNAKLVLTGPFIEKKQNLLPKEVKVVASASQFRDLSL
ncbi:MAG: MerR family transcriptional regulator [Tenuifilaceae bacterium]|jgi:methanogenic corrinoid protein MtbC1|nr:MerR family transcriptional regulator [Tenuifilaceae bacterium]